jgi:ribosomal protein S18 acetylase RimI-like enzyme
MHKPRPSSILALGLATLLTINGLKLSAQVPVAHAVALSRLKISDNQRYLVESDNSPFFWLGDTAWELFHRLNREEAEQYLRRRAEQGFTVIQAVVLAEIDGLDVPNAYGHLPLVDNDPTRPNEEYFQHVDWIVDKANSLGLRIGMLPTWGSYWHSKKVIFDPQNAEIYGKWLGNRYRRAGIVWILGGDRLVETQTHREILAAMAHGLAEGDGGNHLMTFHPRGGRSSSESFHEAPWLSFNMLQSGHSPVSTNYLRLERDYAQTPIKPCLDGEPAYEYPPDAMPAQRPVGAAQVRRNAYWSVFSGAFGHTYGTHPIWQMYAPGRNALWDVTTPWNESLNLPGATQMMHLKKLMLSRPFLTRIPDQNLVANGQAEGIGRVQATRDGNPNHPDATYAFIYIPDHRQVTINTQSIAAAEIRAWWFDPIDGTSNEIGIFNNQSPLSFTTPQRTSGDDWVLILDAVSANYPKP